MNTPTFAAARMTESMVNRKDELKALYHAICHSGNESRVVIIEGEGGLGKTRLLSEALWLAGHPTIFSHRSPPPSDKKWDIEEVAIVSELLDFTDVQLHTFNRFLQLLRQAFSWDERAEFPTYEAAIRHYRRKVKDQADYFTIKQAAEDANNAFFDDYQALTSQYRLVWALDTAEQLTFVGTPWLLDKGLLTPKDLTFSTQQQILHLLKEGRLPNTTLILVGRPTAKTFFDQLIAESKQKQVNSKFEATRIKLDVFSNKDVKDYLSQLAQDYKQQHGEDEIGTSLAAMAKDDNRVNVLHLYTGGQPVRLALFVDTLAEDKEEPEVLKKSLKQAKKNVGWDNKKNEADKNLLKAVQFEIEEAFIDLLFAQTEGGIRFRILATLAQAKRGLDVDRLEFIFSYKLGSNVDEWKGDNKLRQEIEEALDPNNPYSLRRLSFIKIRADGRLILQDELYRIYDKHMANDPDSREDEASARQKLYQKLQIFAEQDIKKLKETQRQLREEDERSLRWESPARALSMKFRLLGEGEEQERIELEEAIFETQAEKLHYELRVNPDAGFNDEFNDLAEQMWRAGNLETDAQIQIELWRFLKDEYTRLFITPQPRKSMVTGSTAWQDLERGAQQDDVTRWIKRFFLRGDPKRALEFAKDVENNIATLDDEPTRITLSHTFSKGERTCWREFARIVLAEDIPDAIDGLEKTIEQMKRLLTKDGIPERGEFGFPGHPAEIRLRRATGVTYNNLGIGYTSQGDYQKASLSYANGLRYLRDTKFLAQQAVTRNNLSRVLAEMGLITRATRICRDGLNLRKQLGAENSIAYSYNTMALIYNRGRQPENAWREAVKAVLYFRKLEDERGLGLSLLQLGEALRRLALSKRPQLDTPEELFDAALNVLSEASEIFERRAEVSRQVESLIELGCLYRDYMHYLKDKSGTVQQGRFRQYKMRAIELLKRAIVIAREKKFPQLELDAQDDLAWTYYYANDTEAAEAAIETVFRLVPKESHLKKGTLPPKPEDAEPQVFLQLGKAWAVRGHIRMEQFKARGDKIIDKHEQKQVGHLAVRDDSKAIAALKNAAEAFVLALAYNRLYSVHSVVIATTLDALYGYLKTFNVIAMEDFFKYQLEIEKDYQISELKPKDVTNLETFLRQSFGDYFETVPYIQESG